MSEERKREREAGKGVGLWFWLRLLLLLALLLYGVYVAQVASQGVRRAQAARLGLTDNDGRLAIVRLVPPFGEPPERYLLLLARERSRYRAERAVKGEGRLRAAGILFYQETLRPDPYQLTAPFQTLVLLAPGGTVNEVYLCPSPPCRFIPTLPYKGAIELASPSRAKFGWRMDVERYGEWLYR